MNINTLIISTSAVVAFAIPSVSVAESGVYASLRQSILYTDSGLGTGNADDRGIVDQEYGARLGYDAGPLSLLLAVAQDDIGWFAGVNASAANEETLGMKLKASYAAGSNTLLAVVTSADNEVAANAPLGVALGYQHDLSNRSRVSLELSSVDPDIAGLDASIEGGVMYRHDW